MLFCKLVKSSDPEVCILKYNTLAIFYFLFFLFSASPSHGNDIVGFLVPSSGLGDQSFNDMTYAGLIQARARHGFTLIREQCVDFSMDSHREALEELILRGANIIVVNGWENHDLVTTYASKHPERLFLLNDFPITGITNVVSTVFGQHEGAFLAGALAGWMSKSGKVGFIGGMDMPVIRAFLSGFRDGARYARPDIQISEIFLSTPQDAESGFDNPSLGFTAANTMYDTGVDIIFGAAGLTGNGIIQAARRQQKFVIGVDADQDHMAEGYVLTSVMKRLDKATAEILDKIFSGEEVNGVYTFGLREGGTSLTPMTYTRELIPKEILEKLAKLQQQIIEGEIAVTNPLQVKPIPSTTVKKAQLK